MIGSFLSPFDRAAYMAGAPIRIRQVRLWSEEMATTLAAQDPLDCAHMDRCRSAVVSASRLKVKQNSYGPALVSSRPGEAKNWRCPMPVDDCCDYQAVVLADRLVRRAQ